MKIQQVEAFPIRLPRDLMAATGTAGSPTQLGAPAGAYRWSDTVRALYSEFIETTLVRVTLEDGRIGWGEAQAPVAPRVAAVIVEDLLAAVLTGLDFDGSPEEIGRLYSLMAQSMRVRGQTGGFMLDAVAGVDIALWDLAGQMAGVPVAELIRPGARREVAAYWSGLSGDRVAQAQAAYADGFRLFKVFYDAGAAELVELLAKLRRELPDDAGIAVDLLWRLEDPADPLLEALAPFGLKWIECPFPPDVTAPHHHLKIPLALGESYRSVAEVAPLAGSAEFLQPDLGRCGITGTLRIAAAYGLPVVPHVSIAMGPQIAAAIHTAAALENCPYCEYNPNVLRVANRFLAEPLTVENARYQAPGLPGLGIRLQNLEPWAAV
jgi:galactonate dehydratase